MRKQRDNKGFSLVEVIVVVLIMAVIAVALAPQVMKWVDKARASADFQASDDLLATAQVAVAEFESEHGAVSDESYNITAAGVVVSGGGPEVNAGMIAIIEYYLSGIYPKVQDESGKVFQIQIRDDGKKISVDTVNGNY